jgi:hypothetical protein
MGGAMTSTVKNCGQDKIGVCRVARLKAAASDSQEARALP